MSAIPHGTIGGYDNHRCRCPECTAANAAGVRKYRAGRAKFLVGGVHPTAPHGTANAYGNYSCRCEDCRKAKAAGMRALRDQRRAERVVVDGELVHPSAKHGTRSGYDHFGCRCAECRSGQRARSARRISRKVGAA